MKHARGRRIAHEQLLKLSITRATRRATFDGGAHFSFSDSAPSSRKESALYDRCLAPNRMFE